MRTTTRKSPGPAPAPRRRVNPNLYNVVRACGTPGWLLAYKVGITHSSQFSILINADSVPATTFNIERLERIADAVGFDRALLFLDGAR